jgi:hypothetical protein
MTPACDELAANIGFVALRRDREKSDATVVPVMPPPSAIMLAAVVLNVARHIDAVIAAFLTKIFLYLLTCVPIILLRR